TEGTEPVGDDRQGGGEDQRRADSHHAHTAIRAAALSTSPPTALAPEHGQPSEERTVAPVAVVQSHPPMDGPRRRHGTTMTPRRRTGISVNPRIVGPFGSARVDRLGANGAGAWVLRPIV